MRHRTTPIRLLIASILLHSPCSQSQSKPQLAIKGLFKANAGLPSVPMNGNDVTLWVRSDGFFNWQVKQSWNGEFPKGSGVGTVFSEGIVFGGIVHDGVYPDSVRVTGDTYFIGMQPGAIQSDASGNTIGADNPADPSVRAFAIRPDLPLSVQSTPSAWPDLKMDAATFLQKDTASVSETDIQRIASQYFTDWKEWPAKKGAPWFIDSVKIVRNDAGFDPTNPHHIPGIPDAAKTIWFVCNDLNIAVSKTFAGSPPIGMEEQMTLWAYNLPDPYKPLSNVIFKLVKLIYEGNPGSVSTSHIDSMYVAQWADADVGDSRDDFVGSDSLLNLGYAYNASPQDAKYSAAGLSVPAVGYVLLQGVSHRTGVPVDSAKVDFQWRKGYKNWHKQPLSSFLFVEPIAELDDPSVGYPLTLMWYNVLRGCLARPSYPAGLPYYASSTYATSHNIVTSYAYSGDPVTRSGWVDGIDFPAGDRRLLCSYGAFSMNLHDTAEVAVALVDGMGTTNLRSLQVLKYDAGFAQLCYNTLFNPSSVVTGINQQGMPRTFELLQNYPNPFNPSTTIGYRLPATSSVILTIYNVLGQEVKTLVNETQSAGERSVAWNSTDNSGRMVSSGVYFYRVSITSLSKSDGSFTEVRKMILLK